MLSSRCTQKLACGQFKGLSPTFSQKRGFMFEGWLVYVWNKYDRSRVEEVGPDRAASEWLLRCGAHVRFQNQSKFTTDYNLLPQGNGHWKIESIDASDSCVSSVGFDHFAGLQRVKELKLVRCNHVTDASLAKLSRLRESLQYLEVITCGNVTDEGVTSLKYMVNLKHLILYDLPGVAQREQRLKELSAALRGCEVKFPAVDPNKPLELN